MSQHYLLKFFPVGYLLFLLSSAVLLSSALLSSSVMAEEAKPEIPAAVNAAASATASDESNKTDSGKTRLGTAQSEKTPSGKKSNSGPGRVAFIGNVKQVDFETKILPFYREVAHCQKCEIVNLTPYGEGSEVAFEKLWQTVLEVPEEFSIIYLHWNEPLSEGNRAILDELNAKLNRDILLVGYAGQPRTTGPTLALNKTVLGQIHQALIVGELTERERLLPQLFYGPEMITAVRPPREYLEQGLSPLLFVSTLAKQIHQRKSQDWPEHLRRRKSKNKKLWPEIYDLF